MYDLSEAESSLSDFWAVFMKGIFCLLFYSSRAALEKFSSDWVDKRKKQRINDRLIHKEKIEALLSSAYVD